MHTMSMDLSARISRKSRTPLAWPLVAATARSRLRSNTSHTAETTTFSWRIAALRFERPILPMPMNAAESLSFAPRRLPVKIWVVSAAVAADLKKSRRLEFTAPILLEEIGEGNFERGVFGTEDAISVFV